jgi:hypothetical protein
MSVRQFHLRLSWGLALGLFAASLPALSQDEPLQAFGPRGALTLIPRSGGATLELPGSTGSAAARKLDLPVPQGTYLSSLQATAGGWVVAGDAPGVSGKRSLVVLRGQGTGVQGLLEPGDATAGERLSPVVLVDRGKLAGLAWLEGDAPRGLAVSAAAWTGKGWSAPVWESRPGPGSQLALQGAVLRDGSWLLAWSAFDGSDDEVVWSRRTTGREAAWSAPKPVSAPNGVPDVMPALVATRDGGAWIAWNRFQEAGYELRAARFEGGEWRGEKSLAPAGSLYPGFVEDRRGEPALLYFQMKPQAWSLLTFDGQGRIEERALAAIAAGATPRERPAVTFEAGGDVRLRFPGSGREQRTELRAAGRVPR